jgi:hypothetical protein
MPSMKMEPVTVPVVASRLSGQRVTRRSGSSPVRLRDNSFQDKEDRAPVASDGRRASKDPPRSAGERRAEGQPAVSMNRRLGLSATRIPTQSTNTTSSQQAAAPQNRTALPLVFRDRKRGYRAEVREDDPGTVFPVARLRRGTLTIGIAHAACVNVHAGDRQRVHNATICRAIGVRERYPGAIPPIAGNGCTRTVDARAADVLAEGCDGQ